MQLRLGKIWLYALAAAILLTLLFNQITRDDDEAIESPIQVSEGDLREMLALVDGAGQRCDQVNAVRPALLSSQEFLLFCDDYRYSYTFEKTGGNWTLRPD